MKKVLVTGGDGFIGSHLVSHLLSLGIEVLVLDKSIHKPTFCDISEAQFIEGDLLSRGLVRECLQQVDTCFHLAALVSITDCARDWIFSHENNVLAFNGLLEEIRHSDHKINLVYTSSCAVYGDSTDLPLKESGLTIPRSNYAADKLSNEIYALAMSHLYAIHAIGLRLFNVYGPGQMDGSSYTGVITCFKNAIKSNEPMKIYGDGQQTRDFICVEDVVAAFMAAAGQASTKSGVYNICTGKSTSITDLAELMQDLSGVKVPVVFENPRPGDVYHSLGDGFLAKKELDFSPQIEFKTGIAEFLAKTI